MGPSQSPSSDSNYVPPVSPTPQPARIQGPTTGHGSIAPIPQSVTDRMTTPPASPASGQPAATETRHFTPVPEDPEILQVHRTALEAKNFIDSVITELRTSRDTRVQAIIPTLEGLSRRAAQIITGMDPSILVSSNRIMGDIKNSLIEALAIEDFRLSQGLVDQLPDVFKNLESCVDILILYNRPYLSATREYPYKLDRLINSALEKNEIDFAFKLILGRPYEDVNDLVKGWSLLSAYIATENLTGTDSTAAAENFDTMLSILFKSGLTEEAQRAEALEHVAVQLYSRHPQLLELFMSKVAQGYDTSRIYARLAEEASRQIYTPGRGNRVNDDKVLLFKQFLSNIRNSNLRIEIIKNRLEQHSSNLELMDSILTVLTPAERQQVCRHFLGVYGNIGYMSDIAAGYRDRMSP